MKKRAVFLDRDGVINPVVYFNGKTYPPELAHYKLFSYSFEAVQKLKKSGFLVFVVTNQPDVSSKLIDLSELESVHAKIQKELLVDEVISCYHLAHHQCTCRKPKPGMLHTLERKWGIDLSASFMVGDRWRDIEAGENAGCCTLLVGDGYGEKVIKANYYVRDLLEASDLIAKISE